MKSSHTYLTLSVLKMSKLTVKIIYKNL